MKLPPLFKAPGVYVEIGQNSIKVLDGEDGLELSLDRLENGRLSPLCGERLTLGLRVFLKKHQWRPRLRAFCAIEARGVSLRRLTIPAASREELHRVLRFQIEREFPLPPEELAWGYCPLDPTPPSGAGGGAPQTLLVAAVKKEVLQDYERILSSAGLNPVFTLGALARSFAGSRANGSHAILDIGRSHSELVVLENGCPGSIHILPWGGDDLTRAIESSLAIDRAEAERLKVRLAELPASDAALRERVLSAIRTELAALARLVQVNGTAQKLYLAGKTARLQEVGPMLATSLGGGRECEPMQIEPGEGRSATILGLKRWVEEGGGAPPMILHLEKSRDTGLSAQPAQWKWAALAGLLALAALSVRYLEPVIQKPRLTAKLSELRAYRERLPQIDRELDFLQHLKTNQPPHLEALWILAEAAPRGARIESLTMNRRGDLSLQAGMKEAQQAVDFRAKLVDSGFFSAVVLEEQTPTPDRQKMVVRLSGRWKPAIDRKE